MQARVAGQSPHAPVVRKRGFHTMEGGVLRLGFISRRFERYPGTQLMLRLFGLINRTRFQVGLHVCVCVCVCVACVVCRCSRFSCVFACCPSQSSSSCGRCTATPAGQTMAVRNALLFNETATSSGTCPYLQRHKRHPWYASPLRCIVSLWFVCHGDQGIKSPCLWLLCACASTGLVWCVCVCMCALCVHMPSDRARPCSHSCGLRRAAPIQQHGHSRASPGTCPSVLPWIRWIHWAE